jgi:outer membrane scaffolding protein for murein synthesis (MipA/OmpV family)
MAVTATNDLTPPDGMVICAITMVGDDIKFDKLTADTSNSVVYGGSESNNAYFGIANANTNGNGEAVVSDGTPVFPAGLTIYGRWTAVSLHTADADGGIIAYFGF